MKFRLISIVVVLAVSFGAIAGDNPRVALETSKGKIVLELYADKTPPLKTFWHTWTPDITTAPFFIASSRTS
jgi:hypothetical protein